MCWTLIFIIGFGTTVTARDIEINVSSNPNYRTFSLSTTLKRHLFIQTKGNIIMPNIGFFLDLSKEDAAKLNTKTIVYIPLDNQQYFDVEVRSFRVNATKLSTNEWGVYFGKEYNKTDSQTASIAQQQLVIKDTFRWSSLFYYDDYTFTQDWIRLLDDTTPISVEYMGYAATTDGCFPFYDYGLEPADNIAREKLATLRLLFPEINTEWSQSEWQNWFDNLMNYKEKPLSECNPNVWNMKWKYDQNFKSLFYTNTFNNLMGVVASKPYHKDLSQQQFVYFDQLKGKTYVYDLHTAEQPFNDAITSFVWNKEYLYFVTPRLKWVRYSYNSSNDMYEQKESVSLLPSGFLMHKERMTIMQQYNNDTIAYYLVKKNEDALTEYYLFCVQIQTGKLLAYKSFKETLPPAVWKELSNYKFKNLKYGTNIQDYFVLGFQHITKAASYIVKIESHLENTKSIEIPQAVGWNPSIITTPDDIIIADYASGVLQRTYLANDLEVNKKTQTLKLVANTELADNGYIYATDNTINIVTEFSDRMHNGVVKYAVGISDNTINESCVYLDIPFEEKSSDNSKQIFYGTINSKQSQTIFFKDGRTLRFVNVD